MRFGARALVFLALVVALFGLLVARFVYLQVQNHDMFVQRAESNRTAIIPIVPDRGRIMDRNGVLLATNYSAYTLEVTPSRVERPIDEMLDELAQIVEISHRDRRIFERQINESRRFDSVLLRTRLSEEEMARFIAQRYRFPEIELNTRLFRSYPMNEVGAHVIGYIGRIDASDQARIEMDSAVEANYRGTDNIGKVGIEKNYEEALHGVTGVEEMEKVSGGRVVRLLERRPATPGANVILSLDIKLQRLIERLYGQRRGALVAMDPRTGEVLALVSMPTFDLNLFVGGIDHENWRLLNDSVDKPLLNRALRGTYPPGSTYKPFMALAALETGKRTAQQTVFDGGSWEFGNHVFRSHGSGGPGVVDLQKAITVSSNVYFYTLANEMGVNAIHDFMAPLGFGQITGIDIQGEMRGVLPSTEWKRETYKNPEQKKWYAGETISLGIGQGYNSFTMLQLAQATSIIANGGTRHTPHLVRALQANDLAPPRIMEPRETANLDYKLENIRNVRLGMVGVTQQGTGRQAFMNAAYESAGKTGTAQAKGIGQKERYDKEKFAEIQRDHALYIGFAPAEDPTIALALIVENAGWGSSVAAPIARRVFDYWVAGLYPSEEDILAVQQGKTNAPIGTPRSVHGIPIAAEGSAAN